MDEMRNFKEKELIIERYCKLDRKYGYMRNSLERPILYTFLVIWFNGWVRLKKEGEND